VDSWTPPRLGDLSWRTARRCNGGNCVRVAASGDMIIIGDSKSPDGPVLAYSPDEWTAFVEGIRHGDFDNLT
jgi:predicted secreted Zn-dependent protease